LNENLFNGKWLAPDSWRSNRLRGASVFHPRGWQLVVIALGRKPLDGDRASSGTLPEIDEVRKSVRRSCPKAPAFLMIVDLLTIPCQDHAGTSTRRDQTFARLARRCPLIDHLSHQYGDNGPSAGRERHTKNCFRGSSAGPARETEREGRHPRIRASQGIPQFYVAWNQEITGEPPA